MGRTLAYLLAFLLTGIGARALAETPEAVAQRYKLNGEVLIGRGDRVVDQTFGTITPGGSDRHRAGERWRLASITKQVTAALLLQDPDIALDRPIDATRINVAGLTLRQLLTHHSGLPNPDATPPAQGGVPAFYTRIEPDLAYCANASPAPGAAFSYNNCDYILAARVAPRSLVWPGGLRMARPGEVGIVGYLGTAREPHFELASYDAAGGLVGTARAVWNFDRALMTGRLLRPAAREALWQPEGHGSAQALGQWVFTAPLKGCAAPVRIVQRDGEIYGVQARNFILPERDMAVIVFTNRSSDDFKLGEVWEQSGFVFDLLSAAACGTPAA